MLSGCSGGGSGGQDNTVSFLSWDNAATMKPVIAEFEKRGVLVGRPFPPMEEHLRVSVGTPDEMKRFAAAFREIMLPGAKAASGG
jgi:histidinol-phosphate/aromatic aminotransferase/cobyric acid decarboxylase-like protein